MTLQWISASLLTGNVIADLPSLDPDWPLKRTISADETATFTLHLGGAPENWETATQDGGAVLACYDDSDPNAAIMWAGYVTSAVPDWKSDDLPISAATFEAVLDRAYVGDTTYFTTQHRDDVIADLLTTWFTPGTGITVGQSYTAGGGPLLPSMDSPPIANAAIVMQNSDNAKVKTRMDQIFGQLGGEYTVEWSWANNNTRIVPTVVWGTRLGTAARAGQDPAVTFEGPGSLDSFARPRDYSDGAGANKVVGYSSGQGSTTPFSATQTAPRDGRPIFEYRYQPAPNISPSALDGYVSQAVRVLGPGARPIAMTAVLARSGGRRLGSDWFLGDDIGYRIANKYTNEMGQTVPALAFPNGVEGVGRVIGYELPDAMTITPILAESTVYMASA